MRRNLKALIMFIPFISTACTNSDSLNNSKKMDKQQTSPIYEIALFTIKDSSNFIELNDKAIHHLSSYDGYISSKTYQNLSNERTYLDIVKWNSLEAAKKAQQKFENSTNNYVNAYTSNIDQILYFGHLMDIDKGVLKYHEFSKTDILELAMIHINPNQIQQFSNARINIMNHIGNNYNSFKEVQTLKSLTNSTQFVDLARWENAEQCHIAQNQLENDPIFIEFASQIDPQKNMIMDFFKQII